MMAATTEGWAMRKKYVVRLTAAERATLEQIVRKLKGSSQKVRRANILLKADAAGPAWPDARIAEAYGCRRQTVENLRQRLVTEGFESAVTGQARTPRPKILDGTQEAKIIALRLGPPPAGYAHWSLRLLAGRVVNLATAPHISYETVRRTPKKRGCPPASWSTGSSRHRPTRSSWRGWRRCWTPTRPRTIRGVRCCAWTSSPCNCCGRRARRSRRP